MSGVKLIIDGCVGWHMPSVFVEKFDLEMWNMGKLDLCEIIDILSDREHEYYNEMWVDVIDNLTFTDENNNNWSLYQDDNLFAICYELMTEEEKESFGFVD